METTLNFIRVWFSSTFEFFTLKHPALGISFIAIMLGVILCNLTIRLFCYAFGFSGVSFGRLQRGDKNDVVRKE